MALNKGLALTVNKGLVLTVSYENATDHIKMCQTTFFQASLNNGE